MATAARIAATPDSDKPFPEMQELKTHNHLLGDKAALDQAWESDGYWFFRDVLDKGAVAKLRRVYTDELEKLGVIDPVGDASTERSVVYNGGSLESYPSRMEPIQKLQPWRPFVREPGVDGFFRKLFGEAPFWVPVVEYRATPPQQDPAKPRFDAIHQDGPYSPGIPFRICWFPLAEITPDTGGMAITEGLTEQTNRHPTIKGSNQMIPLDDLPDDCWRHTTFQAGDVLLVNLWTPHSGITNLSDRFRLSMDHRVMGISEKCPLVGKIDHISSDSVTVNDGTQVVTFKIVDSTYVRNDWGQKLMGDDIAAFHTIGRDVIVAYDGDVASVVRPTH
jgi:hypothetical protein